MRTWRDHELKGNDRVGCGAQIQIDAETNALEKGGLMRCHRCNGVMIYEKFYGDCEYFFGWRCVTCGEILDQVILENRLGNMR